jgi:hypothetical protein
MHYSMRRFVAVMIKNESDNSPLRMSMIRTMAMRLLIDVAGLEGRDGAWGMCGLA